MIKPLRLAPLTFLVILFLISFYASYQYFSSRHDFAQNYGLEPEKIIDNLSSLCSLSHPLTIDDAPMTGAWYGYWGNNELEHLLIITESDETNVSGYYVHGSNLGWQISEPACLQFPDPENKLFASLSEDGLTLQLGRATVTYTFKDDVASGTYSGGNNKIRGIFNPYPLETSQ